MLDLSNIYKITKQIDEQFALHYGNEEEIVRKNRLELLVELGELANETRCFKYWSIKQTGEKEKVLEEYIDCLFMTLYFSNITGISLDEEFPSSLNGDIIDTFLSLNKFASSISVVPKKEEVKKILVELDHLAKLLNFTIEDLERVTKIKSKIIESRFNSEY
jgi:dimeric dUTPase (all-alpha-NTP-PPase superfamily)